MDDKILISREELNSLKAASKQLSMEVNLRKQAEEKLEKSNNELAERNRELKQMRHMMDLYEAILDNAAYIVVSTDREGIINSINPAAERALGYTSDEMVGKLTPVVFHDQDEIIRYAGIFSAELGIPVDAGFEVFAAKARIKLPNEHEWTFIRKDGSRFPVLLSVTALYNPQGNIIGFMGIANDITERKAVEETLKKSEIRLNEAQRIAHIGSWELDIVNDILYWSDEIYRIFEIDPQKFCASYEAFLNAIHPEDRDSVNEAYTDSLKDKAPYDIVHRLKMPDGRIKFVNEKCETYYGVDGNPLRSLGTVHDITERVTAEETIASREMVLRNMAESSPGLMGTFYQRPDGSICMPYTSPQIQNLFGLRPEDVVEDATLLLSRTHPDDAQMVKESIFESARSMTPWHCEYRVLHPTRGVLWMEGSTNPKPHANGGIIWYGFVHDITKRKLAETALRESEEKYRTLIQKIQTAVIVHGTDTQIITCNTKAQELLGLTEDQLLGKTAIDPGWHFYREDHTILPVEEYPVNLVMANQQVLRNYIVGVNRIDRKVWVLVNADPVLGREGEIIQVIVSFSDITELKQLEAEQERINRALRMLSDINQALIHNTEESTLLDEVCRIIIDTGGYRLAWVGFAEHDEAKTLRPVSHAGTDSGYILSAKVTWAENEHGRGLGGTAIRTGKPSIVRYILSDPDFAPWREAALQRDYKSLIALPLISDDNTIGALGIYSVCEDAFDTKEVEILEELANDLAFGITALRIREKQKQAEESLAKSEDRFRRLAENARDVIFRMSIPEGKYEYVSPASLSVFGYTPEECYQTPKLIKQSIHPDWHNYFEEQWANLLKGLMPPMYEYQFIHKSGDVRWLNQRNILVYDDSGTPIAIEGIVTDITSRKRAEESQEKERKRMEVLLSSLNTGLSLINPDMTIAWVNQKIREMFPFGEPVGHVCHVFYESRETICEGCGTLKAFQTENVIESEQFVPSINRWYYIISQPIKDSAGRVVNVLEGITDITERKHAEEKLKLLNFALNNVYDEVYLINEQACFQYVNDQSCRALGYNYEEFLRMNVAEVDPDFPLELWHQHWTDLKKQNSIVFQSYHKTKDGRFYPVEISANYFEYNGQGYNLTLVRDISDRKKAEEEIMKLNQELEKRVSERTSQLELANKELKAFSYSVSHDLRTPLRAIDGFSQALLDEYLDKVDDRGKQYIKRVRSATQRMAQLIDDMLGLSRVSRTEMNIQQVNLSTMFIEIADELRETLPERQVKFIIQEKIIAQGDGRLLRIVLENLIGNAWKFTYKHENARIEFGIQQQKEVAAYFVRDDGAGFNMEYAHKLFGAFQRLHTATEFPGTGIGLATVQRIIHRHGGKVWAEGEEEKGATFYFTIP